MDHRKTHHRGKTQGAGARALESALAVPGVSLATLARDGLLRSLTLAHQRCPQSRSVALSLCRVMGKAMDPGKWNREDVLNMLEIFWK